MVDYTTNLMVEQPTVGGDPNIWGNKLNTGLGLLDTAITGRVAYTLSGSKTLVRTPGSATNDTARGRFQDITGGTGGTVTIPALPNWYLVRNNSSGIVTFTTGGGDTALIAPETVTFIVCDGANVWTPDIDGAAALAQAAADAAEASATEADASADAAALSAIAAALSAAQASASVPGLQILQSGTITSAVAALDITTGITNAYDEYELHILSLMAVNDGVAPRIVFSRDGGAIWDNTGGDYAYVLDFQSVSSASISRQGSQSVASIIAGQLQTNTRRSSIFLKLIMPSDASGFTRFFGKTLYHVNSPVEQGRQNWEGTHLKANPMNAVRIFFSAGNIASATYKLYGIKKS